MGKTVQILAGIAVLLTALAPVLAVAPAAQADTSDFSYDSWHVDYQLDTDKDGRSITHVKETLTARFPDFDQNRGLVRGLPIDYEGTSTDPRDFSVTDLEGKPIPFELEKDDTFIAVLTGNDDYVRGVQTYVISYTLSDTILARDDGSADEFYWDLVDFEHEQPIKQFSANISLSPELASKLNGNYRCYAGAAGSNNECNMNRNDSGTEFTVPGIPLAPQEGVTVAIGLAPGAVTQPGARLPNFALDTLPLYIGGITAASGIATGIAVLLFRRKRRVSRGVVVAQYDVPATLPPLIAGPIVGAMASPVPAEFVHLAVSGVTRIEEAESKKKSKPAIRLMDLTRIGDELDAETTRDLFPSQTVGEVVEIPQKSEIFARRMSVLKSLGSSQALKRGYFENVASPVGRKLGFVTLGVTAILVVFAVIGIMTRNSVTPFIAIAAASVGLVLGLVGVIRQRVHTPLGAETREYLEGVREFIRVAEADRIRVLQSYEGAERFPDGTINVVHLYEKLLPYAMLFGLEREWSKTLETRYQESPGYVPYWYPAVGLHGISSFNSTLSDFTSSLTSSASYTSSSSGGSTGGGFSGGGGGGGFSGGR
ncbi:DUF2207 domain-containing protein [Leucobacter viscericola]|uniref:DUF2207 domain-containing protein n=1 Tax=Leucobacter viscericola TaxID=2714935 RepID=A0A6G7XBW0_9MICO|nr:DUF2207 domain-containing protein [Leucobacter viscericola]QIK62090.1 DUF2207 domain-containing protein [Leucobacter viscericola]